MTLYTRHESPSGRVTYTPYGEAFAADAWPIGAHLVVVEPGCRATMYGVHPDHAGALVALREHRDELIKLVTEAMRGRPASPLPLYIEERLRDVWFSVGSPAGVVDTLTAAVAARVAAVTP